jgi:hypothetical protein
MISIIICSINQDYLHNVSENISKTIGIEYELLVWDNRYEKKGICEVYNIMAKKAKYPQLCFLHEDIFFETQDWGVTLTGLFRDNPGTGVIGVAGSAYKSAMFSGWYTGNKDYDVYNYTHRINGVDHKDRQPTDKEEVFYPVVCIDGVLVACRREAWEDIQFDAEGLKGFHFYDIDFSLRAARKYGIGVTMQIDLVHITQGGDYGNRWVDVAIRYHSQQGGRLPYFLGEEIDGEQIKKSELNVARLWLDRLKTEDISLHKKWEWINKQVLLRKGAILWYPILRFLVFRPFKLHRLQRLIKRNHPSN